MTRSQSLFILLLCVIPLSHASWATGFLSDGESYEKETTLVTPSYTVYQLLSDMRFMGTIVGGNVSEGNLRFYVDQNVCPNGICSSDQLQYVTELDINTITVQSIEDIPLTLGTFLSWTNTYLPMYYDGHYSYFLTNLGLNKWSPDTAYNFPLGTILDRTSVLTTWVADVPREAAYLVIMAGSTSTVFKVNLATMNLTNQLQLPVVPSLESPIVMDQNSNLYILSDQHINVGRLVLLQLNDTHASPLILNYTSPNPIGPSILAVDEENRIFVAFASSGGRECDIKLWTAYHCDFKTKECLHITFEMASYSSHTILGASIYIGSTCGTITAIGLLPLVFEYTMPIQIRAATDADCTLEPSWRPVIATLNAGVDGTTLWGTVWQPGALIEINLLEHWNKQVVCFPPKKETSNLPPWGVVLVVLASATILAAIIYNGIRFLKRRNRIVRYGSPEMAPIMIR